ncbi:MAG TPA: hypothetical protein VKV15_13230 [Bryobacteraceae bacterium]|nr:hypothetical protein [Bryobacteraceae bacterium]
MRVIVRARKRNFAVDEEPQARLAGLLRELRQVPYYCSVERRRELEAGSLEALAPVELSEFLEQRARFSAAGVHVPVQIFEYPLSPAPRTAVLHRGFRSSLPVRVFPDGWSDAVSAFAPEAIAAPAVELSRLARAVRSGQVTLPALRHAAIAFVDLGEELPQETERDLWWEVFEIPVFEYLLGPGGEVLAIECEARDGLHWLAERAVFEVDRGELLVTPLSASVARLRSGWAGEIETALCPCGRPGARLTGLRQLARRRFAATLAS